jgi:hypothetical protein
MAHGNDGAADFMAELAHAAANQGEALKRGMVSGCFWQSMLEATGRTRSSQRRSVKPFLNRKIHLPPLRFAGSCERHERRQSDLAAQRDTSQA